MKVALIRPNIGRLDMGRYIDEGRMEPLSLAVLAGATPKDIELVLHDDRMEDVPFDDPVALAAISVETFNARRAYQIAAAYRARGVPVILGGIHAKLAPREAAEHADSIFIGEAEHTWPLVLEDAHRGALRAVYQATADTPQKGLLPRRDIFLGKKYLPVTLLQFGRGCTFACEFCAVSASTGRRHFHRDVAEVVREIEAQQQRNVFFVDDNIVCDQQAAKELFRALTPLRIHWVSQGSIDMTADRELMDLMVDSGCMGHVIGFESIDPADLRAMGKAPNLDCSLDRYAAAIEVLREYGLQTWAAFTIGHDNDTVESIERLTRFAIDSKFAFAAFNLLAPYPGTPFYARLAAEGRLLYDGRWWLDPLYRFNYATFRPRRMSPEELTAAGIRARERFNSAASIFWRAIDFKTHLRSPRRLGIYLSYTPLFRREIFRKTGMWLGAE
jgi:radical SAM superfamily enzyme YgiQ (UPF0313 family)